VRVLIVGLGYVGQALGARLLKEGHRVFGLRRSASTTAHASGIMTLQGDVTKEGTLQRLSGPFDWVVNAVSSSKGGPDEYRAVYLEGTRNLLNWARDQQLQKYVSVSSTSVYGQTDGSWVEETSPTEPGSETGRILVEGEKLLLATATEIPAVILRASGIYGPERGHLFQQYLRGEASISGDPRRWLNMIHRDDLAGAIIAACEHGRAGEIYNATDDEPVTLIDFFQWLSTALKRPIPPAADVASTRKRAVTNKRISNAKLKRELEYAFLYPTYKEGYSAETQRLGLG
jgi:nucleoside-diphosphate-sugar epimerase